MRPLYEALKAKGLLEFGASIPGAFVREVLDLDVPEQGTRAEFNKLQLAEMAGVDSVREMLLNEGKYIKGEGADYRILTPGENAAQVDRYLGSAQNKIRRARKLERTTPAVTSGKPSQAAARIAAALRGAARRDGASPTV